MTLGGVFDVCFDAAKLGTPDHQHGTTAIASAIRGHIARFKPNDLRVVFMIS